MSHKTKHKTPENYLNRAFELAKKGSGLTAPNPMVGAVIVHKDRIIGEGYTSPFGGPHAEVNAIYNVSDADLFLLKEATCYVTLEPCSHYGKTPPCANLLIEKKIKKVIISNIDPNPIVAGNGVAKLKAAGVEVECGILEEKGWWMNRRFFTFHQQKRPYIILKWAQSKDGFMGAEGASFWFTNQLSQRENHKWRAQEAAILIGTQTALQDNPRLNCRYASGENPIRIVLDINNRLPSNLHIFDGSQPTIILTGKKTKANRPNLLFEEIDSKNVVAEILRICYEKKILSLLIEGGKKTLDTFIQAELWDEARILIGEKGLAENLGNHLGILAPKVQGLTTTTTKIKTDTLKLVYAKKHYHID